MKIHHLIPKLLIFIIIKTRWSHSIPLNSICSSSFSCGTISGFKYPFRRHQDPIQCGYPGFELNCDQLNPPTINIMNITYQILGVDPTTQILKLIRGDMIDSVCPQNLVNTTIDHSLFDYTPSYTNISILFGCPLPFDVVGLIGPAYCGNIGVSVSPVFLVSGVQGPGICNTSVVIPSPVGFSGMVDVLQKGFDVKWKVESRPCIECTGSGGQCVFDIGTRQTTCACREPPFLNDRCSKVLEEQLLRRQKFHRKWKLVTGVLVSCGLTGIVILLFVMLYRAEKLKKTQRARNHEIEMAIRNYGNLAPKRFKYREIKKITNSFLEKLGQGGYGSVYKGQLPNGQPVAVKLLTGAHGDGEDFINEVTSISNTSHVNIVTLLGFCINGKKRALMYELMPNGSLDKFLRGNGSHLDWDTLFHVAKGIARGLQYLHRGCNTRIVHFDIKPHNILLDEKFVPKISDFGLAKLCKTKESIVSVTGVRGTVGYIAPEVYFRSLGGVSHKSDVYSYGMMVLEMTGARKQNNSTSISTSEAYFPDWVYKQVEVGGNLRDCGVNSEEDEELARKMMIVSLWCIQSDPSDRPSIDKVVEMLEGSFESLHIPTKRSGPSLTRPFQGTLPSSRQSKSSESGLIM